MSLHQARGVGRGQELCPEFSCCFSMGMQRGTAQGRSHRAHRSPPKAFFLSFLLHSRALNPTAWPWPQQCAGPVLRAPRAINGKKTPTALFSCHLQPQPGRLRTRLAPGSCPKPAGHPRKCPISAPLPAPQWEAKPETQGRCRAPSPRGSSLAPLRPGLASCTKQD